MTVFDYNNIIITLNHKSVSSHLYLSLIVRTCTPTLSYRMYRTSMFILAIAKGFLSAPLLTRQGGLPGKDAQCYASSKPMTWSCRHIMPLTHNCLNEHCKWMDEDFAHPYLNIKRNHDVYTSISTKL